MKYFWFYKSDDEWRYFSSKRKAIFHAIDNGYEANETRTDYNNDYIIMGTDANWISITKEYVE